MEPVGQRLTLFALEFDQTMWDVVLIQKIVELMGIPRAARSEHTQSCKLAIATQPPSSHDQRVHDWFADPWQFGQCPSEFIRGHVQNLGFIRCHSRSRERRCPLQHCHVADEIALVRNREFLLDVIPPLDYLDFATQNNSQPNVPLASFVHHLATLHDTTMSEWFK